MASITATRSTSCSRCGAALETSSSDDLGCMVCLFGLAFDAQAKDAVADDEFGQYVIQRGEDGDRVELGRGAMGVTYRAADTVLRRAVALKVIDLQRARNASFARERFLREARAAAALRHENIATVHQFGIREETGDCFYAMELVEGQTLDERVRRLGPMSVSDTIEVGLQVCGALQAAEKRGLVHRDLKPGNIMAVASEEADSRPIYKVIDFGVAKALTEQSDPMLLTHGSFVGTPAFASPEQFSSGQVDRRSDIFSLGATLWFLLTGDIPFAGHSVEEIRNTQTSQPISPLRLKAAHVPASVISLLTSMLAIEPATRPARARDVAQQLERCRASITRRKLRPLLIAGSVLAASLIAALVTVLLRDRSDVNTAVLPGKSIAVLPFDNLSGDKSDTYFADGIQDDILTSLSKVADLKVISRTSVMQYRGSGKSVREIARALNVANLLEGSVRKVGGRIRVTAQLIDTRTDAHLWAEQYERDVADLFAIESEVSERIVAHLKAKLSPAEEVSIEAQPTRDLEAYDLYLRAKEVLFEVKMAGFEKWDGEMSKAVDLLKQAVARDPSFAVAFSLLSRTYTSLFWEQDTVPALEESRKYLELATRLAPDAGETHFARAFYFFHGREDNERSLAEFDAAMRLLPNNSEVFAWAGMLERRMNRWSDALRHLHRAIELDPHNPITPSELIKSYQMLRDYRNADLVADHSLIAIPKMANQLHTIKATTAWFAGDSTKCRAMLSLVASDYQQGGFIAYLQTRAAILDHDYPQAERILAAWPLKDTRLFTKAWVARDRAYIGYGDADPATRRLALENARALWQARLEADGESADIYAKLAMWDAGLGRKEQASREIQKAIDLRPMNVDATNGINPLIARAVVYAWSGERELALKQLELLATIPGGTCRGELQIPMWRDLQSEPRFQKVLAATDAPLSVASVSR